MGLVGYGMCHAAVASRPCQHVCGGVGTSCARVRAPRGTCPPPAWGGAGATWGNATHERTAAKWPPKLGGTGTGSLEAVWCHGGSWNPTGWVQRALHGTLRGACARMRSARGGMCAKKGCFWVVSQHAHADKVVVASCRAVAGAEKRRGVNARRVDGRARRPFGHRVARGVARERRALGAFAGGRGVMRRACGSRARDTRSRTPS